MGENTQKVKRKQKAVYIIMAKSSYFAGLFDGEGNIGFMYSSGRKQPGSIRCRVTMKGDKIPLLFKKKYGGRITLFSNGCKQWDVAATEAVNFLKDVLSYLILKKKVALLALEYQSKIGRKGGRLADKQMKERKEYYLKMRALNQETYV